MPENKQKPKFRNTLENYEAGTKIVDLIEFEGYRGYQKYLNFSIKAALEEIKETQSNLEENNLADKLTRRAIDGCKPVTNVKYALDVIRTSETKPHDFNKFLDTSQDLEYYNYLFEMARDILYKDLYEKIQKAIQLYQTDLYHIYLNPQQLDKGFTVDLGHGFKLEKMTKTFFELQKPDKQQTNFYENLSESTNIPKQFDISSYQNDFTTIIDLYNDLNQTKKINMKFDKRQEINPKHIKIIE